MELKTTGAEFRKQVALAARIAAKNALLSHVQLVASDGALVINVSDGDIFARLTLEAQIAEPGTEVVPASTLAAVLGAVGATVQIESGPKGLNLDYGRGRVTLARYDNPDDFPLFAPATDTLTVLGTIDGRLLAAMIQSVAPYVHETDHLPEKNSISLWTGEVADEFKLYTTDGVRFGRVSAEAATAAAAAVFVPLRPAIAAHPLLVAGGAFTVSRSERALVLSDGVYALRIPLLWSESPPRDLFVWQEGRSDALTFEVNVKDWRDGLKIVEATGAKRVQVALGGETMRLSGKGQMGEAAHPVAIEIIAQESGAEFVVVLDTELLDDALRGCPADKVEVNASPFNPKLTGLAAAHNAVLFRAARWEHFLMMVVPGAQ